MFGGYNGTRLRRAWALASLFPVMAFGLLALLPQAAMAKTPGKTYCFNGICHRVQTLQETATLIGKDQKFKTSFYDDCKRDRFNPCGLTSSGEVFRPRDADNAASPIFPNGTVLLLRNPNNGEAAVVRVNNAGPYWGNRKLDVSRGTAEKLGFKRRGVADLEVRVVYAPTPAEARYKKKRQYDAVPGAIGNFASLAAAGGATLLAMNQFAPSQTPRLALAAASERKPAEKTWQVAASEVLPPLVGISAHVSWPAAALKAEARRESGKESEEPRIAPATIASGIAPIHRARQQYTLN